MTEGSSSILVAQQELLTPPATRRLIVPRGHESWWGVDLGTTRLAVAYVAPDGSRGASTAPFPGLRGSARLAHIYGVTRLAIASLIKTGGWPRPGVVLTEQPSGSKRAVNLPFIMAAGAIHAGLYDGLLDACGLPAHIEEKTSSWWKKRACGSGVLYKPQRVTGQPAPGLTEYAVYRWALENGWSPLDWNEADAAGMADAARREFELDER